MTDDTITRTQGTREQRCTPQGDEYVIDTATGEASDILTPEEERKLDAGELELDDINCDNAPPAMNYTVDRVRVQPEYCDEWETTMVIDITREDGVSGDVWIVVGVPDYLRGSAAAARSNQEYETVRVFGDSPDHWCPDTFRPSERSAIVDAVESAAVAAHRERAV